MKLSEYFEAAKGFGILATADKEGNVDAAVYSRPHFMDEETVAWIMTDRLTHQNVQSNPRAAFIFREEGGGYTGRRLYLTKITETSDREEIDKIRWRKSYVAPGDQKDLPRFLVYFHIDKVLPLIGTGE